MPKRKQHKPGTCEHCNERPWELRISMDYLDRKGSRNDSVLDCQYVCPECAARHYKLSTWGLDAARRRASITLPEVRARCA